MNRTGFLLDWFDSSERKTLWIAGPCGAESRQQVLQTASDLSTGSPVHIMRCGVWKPRTSPGNFEGAGSKALAWLTEARERYNMPFAVEVASHRHVEACLKAEVDMLWIGARTTSSPFAVQEIANALTGIQIPLLVKNPIVPDIHLWRGAIERFYRVGLSRVAAVHRGFYPSGKSDFRNSPMWEIPIEMKRLYPDLRILNDPSHISGKSSLVPIIAQKALDLRFDGLMVEVHPSPENAKSDAEQQLTPHEFAQMIGNLRFPGELSPDDEFNHSLGELRLRIDSLDSRILHLVHERNQLVSEIAQLKMANNVSPLQMKRWDEIIRTRTALASSLGMNSEFVIKILELFHEEALEIQEKIAGL